MGNRKYTLLAPRQCEGCGSVFRPQRRNQTYHNQACKQTAYYHSPKKSARKSLKFAEELLYMKLPSI